MSIVSCQWDKEEWCKLRVIKSAVSFQRVKYTRVHPNTTYKFHYKQGLCRLNCASVQDQLPLLGHTLTSCKLVSSHYPHKTLLSYLPQPPAKDMELSIQWQNSRFLILLGCSHHQISLFITWSALSFCQTSNTAATLIPLKGPVHTDLAAKYGTYFLWTSWFLSPDY